MSISGEWACLWLTVSAIPLGWKRHVVDQCSYAWKVKPGAMCIPFVSFGTGRVPAWWCTCNIARIQRLSLLLTFLQFCTKANTRPETFYGNVATPVNVPKAPIQFCKQESFNVLTFAASSEIHTVCVEFNASLILEFIMQRSLMFFFSYRTSNVITFTQCFYICRQVGIFFFHTGETAEQLLLYL